MKIIVTLNLANREVVHLFSRKIDGKRLFMNTLLHKFNKVISACQESLHLIEQMLAELSHQFERDIMVYSALLARKQSLSMQSTEVIRQFHPKIIVCNQLGMQLVTLIEVYDCWMTTLKLLRLAGGFEQEADYYVNIHRGQREINRALGKIISISLSLSPKNQTDHHFYRKTPASIKSHPIKDI